MRRGFTLVVLSVVIAIIAILVSIAIPQYLNYTERARLASYALPMAKAYMANVASYYSTDSPPAGTETYSIIGNSAFPNCVANYTTPGGTVYFTVVEAFQCSNTGQLIAGKLHDYFSATGQRVVCVALLFPILGRILPRDLSPLKPVLVEGVWDRVRSRLVPLEAGGRPNEGFFRTASVDVRPFRCFVE